MDKSQNGKWNNVENYKKYERKKIITNEDWEQ